MLANLKVTKLQDRCHYNDHFIGEDIEIQKGLSNLAQGHSANYFNKINPLRIQIFHSD